MLLRQGVVSGGRQPGSIEAVTGALLAPLTA
jgi:hypothetical protein